MKGMIQMIKAKQKKQRPFLTWIHTHRLKVAAILFLVILPIALTIAVYVGSYTANNAVYFDQEITENSEKISEFLTIEDLDALSLNIEWDELKKPSENEEGVLYNGYYKFNVSYTPNTNYQIESVEVTPVLKTDWKNYRSVGNKTDITTTYSSFLVNFNYELPTSPLLFVSIDEPHLYLKVEYTYETAGQTISEIDYVKYSLNALNPNKVVPN